MINFFTKYLYFYNVGKSFICDGEPISMETSLDYSNSFKFSMTIKTSPLIGYGNEGIIYSDRGSQSLIEIRWLKNSSIEFVISNAHINERVQTEMLYFEGEFNLTLLFDGETCEWHMNNILVGSVIDCSKGLGELGNPMLCHASTMGWFGWITNLNFEKLGIPFIIV